MQSSMAVRLRSPATGTAAPHSCKTAVVRLHSAHRLLVNRQIAVQPTRASGADKSGGLQAASRLSVIGLSCRVADEHQRCPSPDVGCIYQTSKHGAIHAPCIAAAKEEFEAELATESMDSNILDYCSLDPQVSAYALCRSGCILLPSSALLRRPILTQRWPACAGQAADGAEVTGREGAGVP
jgi:hypothetical protein